MGEPFGVDIEDLRNAAAPYAGGRMLKTWGKPG
jgi:hypothetical protein